MLVYVPGLVNVPGIPWYGCRVQLNYLFSSCAHLSTFQFHGHEQCFGDFCTTYMPLCHYGYVCGIFQDQFLELKLLERKVFTF